MPRIRTIKPEFFKNEQLADLPALARLLFIGLWTQADREGRVEDRPRRLKAELFPYEDYDVDKGLDMLHAAGFIARYEAYVPQDGVCAQDVPRQVVSCIQVVNFTRHQKLDKINEKPSALPGPYDTDAVPIAGDKTSDSIAVAGEGKGREGEGKGTGTARARTGGNDFMPTDAQRDAYDRFIAWMKEHTPNVLAMDRPLTVKQLCILRGEIPNSKGRQVGVSREVCQQILLEIENNRQYLQKYRSPFLCIMSWSDRSHKS